MTTNNLVPIEHHNRLTAWTHPPGRCGSALPAVYGTGSEDDDKRVYRTPQVSL